MFAYEQIVWRQYIIIIIYTIDEVLAICHGFKLCAWIDESQFKSICIDTQCN